MKRVYKVLFVLTVAFFIPLFANNVYAVENIKSNNIVRLDYDSIGDDDANCEYILGDPNKDYTVANMLQKIFDYIKIIGPILVIVLSGFDFAKNALNSDSDKMKKAGNKLLIRLLCAVGLYFVPVIASFIINLVNNTSYEQTCGIK